MRLYTRTVRISSYDWPRLPYPSHQQSQPEQEHGSDRPQANQPAAPVRRRLEAEDHLVFPRRDLDRPEGVVRPVDADRLAVHGTLPAGIPDVGQHEVAVRIAADVQLDAIGLVAPDVDRVPG